MVIFLCDKRYSMINQTQILFDEGIPFVNWWVLPETQSFELLEELKEGSYEPFNVSHRTFATFLAADAINKMYEGTKVGAEFDKIPDELKGIFWFKGNAIPEELVSLQLGRWFEEEQLYVSTIAPYSWAWADGTPTGAPQGGFLYQPNFTLATALGVTLSSTAFSFKFSACPEEAEYCPAGDPDPLGYASMQMHISGYMGATQEVPQVSIPEGLVPFLHQYLTGRFTLEKLDGVEAGARWKRGIWWGVGACQCLEFGSYTLTKVLDKDGKPLEPYYTEFLEYMGDVPILTWTGFTSEQARQDDIAKSEEMTQEILAANGSPPASFTLRTTPEPVETVLSAT